MKLTIDAELKDLIPPLTADERENLLDSLLEDGCREPITVWDGVVIDGHNRYELCTAHNIPYAVREMSFPNKAAAMEWMFAGQLGRRNVADRDRAILTAKLYDLRKKAECQIGTVTTADDFAKERGISRRKLFRDIKLAYGLAKAEELVPGTGELLRTGEIKLPRADIEQMADADPAEVMDKLLSLKADYQQRQLEPIIKAKMDELEEIVVKSFTEAHGKTGDRIREIDPAEVDTLRRHPEAEKYLVDLSGIKWRLFLQSVETDGIITPILISADGETVLNGWQRVRAAKELGIKTVNAYEIADSTPEEELLALLTTNYFST